ncbi:hypothetical protein F5Y19DRAFT_46603 [Xylariaceae sp. FL1651]|nr:hypothetical protein F5Y19DRAFT_46603 [Xylariaceae sp. FL1651]
MDLTPTSRISSAVTVHPATWRKACEACTKSKRQCTKQVPRCRRCLDKGLRCTYPPPRRPDMPITADAAPQAEIGGASLQLTNSSIDEGLMRMMSAGATNPLNAPSDSTFPFLQIAQSDLQGLPSDPSLTDPAPPNPSDAAVGLRGIWFLRPESWRAECTDPPPLGKEELEKSLGLYIERAQSWMRQWATDGHSPLHHRELYSFYMPRHVQDAYTAMTMYMGKNRENEGTVYRILEERVAQLLQDQALEASLGGGTGEGPSIFDHLGRVQALLCYQLIRLFDGNIRMRVQAEELIPTLFLWNRQLLESVNSSLGRPERFLVASPFDPDLLLRNPQMAESPSASSAKAVWRAWILAESVRRTWQAASIVQHVYLFLKRSWAECPGRLPSTMRRALWDAPSAYAWARELRESGDPLLVTVVGLDAVFAQMSPADVDDFNLAAFEIYGMEQAYRWLEDNDRKKPNLLPGWESLFSMNHMS